MLLTFFFFVPFEERKDLKWHFFLRAPPSFLLRAGPPNHRSYPGFLRRDVLDIPKLSYA